MSRRASRGPRSTAGPADRDLVAVAVPVKYLDHVTHLIEELDRSRRHLQVTSTSSPATDVTEQAWPAHELRRFALGSTRSHATITAVLDVLSEVPGKMLLVQEVAAATQQPAKIIIGALAGLTRLVKAHHDYDRYGLPLIRLREYVSGGQEEHRLGISPTQAPRWKRIRREMEAPASNGPGFGEKGGTVSRRGN